VKKNVSDTLQGGWGLTGTEVRKRSWGEGLPIFKEEREIFVEGGKLLPHIKEEENTQTRNTKNTQPPPPRQKKNQPPPPTPGRKKGKGTLLKSTTFISSRGEKSKRENPLGGGDRTIVSYTN